MLGQIAKTAAPGENSHWRTLLGTLVRGTHFQLGGRRSRDNVSGPSPIPVSC